MSPVRVLVVDDSASMRAALTSILSKDPEIEVVGCAPEPAVARAMIKQLNPDVLTLDVEMPGMDGLSFLERVMRLRPMPVVMCSTLTARGTEVTIEALRLGAVDCIAKPSGSPADLARDADRLCQTVKGAAHGRVRAIASAGLTPPPTGTERFDADSVIAIGASTGGVEALFRLVGSLPGNCPPVLIVQHMPGTFTGGFAARLDAVAAPTVKEAQDGDLLTAGTVYIAPGSVSHMVLRAGQPRRIQLSGESPLGGHRPAVDRLFESVAAVGRAGVGVLLTGMGEDGARGLLAMRTAGARTFAQSADSCVVYGMPRAAMAMGAAERQLPLDGMARAILDACRIHNVMGA